VRWNDAYNRLPRIIRFGFVGCVGFCVDTGVLYLALYVLGMSYYGGRIISYAVAASSTWYMNRRFTFADSRNDNRLREWVRFVMLNLFGGSVNYGVYAAYIGMHAGSPVVPAIGVALGSIAGMLVNFYLSRRLVFNARPDSDLTEL
jgi:putative flippase GtrA